MSESWMNEQDAPFKDKGCVYYKQGNRRFPALFVHKFEVNANISTEKVPVLGKRIQGRKPTNMEIKLTMTIYKSTTYFDDMVLQYKDTGYLPRMDVEVMANDPTTSIGTDRKIYNDCIIDGDVLLHALDAEGGVIDQEITMYASDFNQSEKYKDLEFMGKTM
ncbi:hypothetical protein CXIVA_01730 [Clostridium sp. SY8519]|uniref:phage tail tube protein n=1 Tax=Clostridium sp. (strain SY8519) TaxID=1042156 RepID=UPI0002171F73|nr:phage tail tube protein [Clostridium sp. SY8519]BAK46140.1 hypothetical protein CXIVA_01730 [Clostridium sp. SY8519]